MGVQSWWLTYNITTTAADPSHAIRMADCGQD